ncbi:MAG: preprotein translocase subunit SecG [Bifidobacteriaceae bacterium]|jgi:preprotein translocase subunit SecG|nr:preprotein translocase subunit SecG [Bifidobacteriaceae bacterium]
MKEIFTVVLDVVLVLTSLFLVLLILMHKGKGGGLSDMFGGGISSNVGSSGVAEKNLNRITVIVSIIWLIAVVLVGFMQRLN